MGKEENKAQEKNSLRHQIILSQYHNAKMLVQKTAHFSVRMNASWTSKSPCRLPHLSRCGLFGLLDILKNTIGENDIK